MPDDDLHGDVCSIGAAVHDVFLAPEAGFYHGLPLFQDNIEVRQILRPVLVALLFITGPLRGVGGGLGVQRQIRGEGEGEGELQPNERTM